MPVRALIVPPMQIQIGWPRALDVLGGPSLSLPTASEGLAFRVQSPRQVQWVNTNGWLVTRKLVRVEGGLFTFVDTLTPA